MTVRELFDFIKGVRPGFAFSDAQMMVWLNEIEGKVQTDILLLDPAVGEDGTVTGLVEYDVTTDMNTELIVHFPWNKLYRYFMLMSIDLYNGEFQRYGNSFAQFNEAYEEYSAWVAQNLAPANGNAVAHGYYLTAYQFAVKGGYKGTLDDFSKLLAMYAGSAEEVHADRALAEAAAEQATDAADRSETAAGQAEDAAERAETAAEEAAESESNAAYYTQQTLAGYGAPLTAATAADMTDETRIYVYVGSETGYVNGDWYYHDGTEWQDGGEYNSMAYVTDTQFQGIDVTDTLENWTSSYAVRSDNGGNISNASFSASEFLDVSGMEAICFQAINSPTASTVRCAGAFYRSDESFIQPIKRVSTTDGYVFIEQIVPADAKYARFTKLKISATEFRVFLIPAVDNSPAHHIAELETDVAALNDDVTETVAVTSDMRTYQGIDVTDTLTWTANYIIRKNNGNTMSASGYSASSFLDVSGMEAIRFQSVNTPSDASYRCAGAFYRLDESFIEPIIRMNATDGYVFVEQIVPAEAKYVRLNKINAGDPPFSVFLVPAVDNSPISRTSANSAAIDTIEADLVKPLIEKVEFEDDGVTKYRVYMYIPTADKKHYIKSSFSRRYNETEYACGWRFTELLLRNLDDTSVSSGTIVSTGEWETALAVKYTAAGGGTSTAYLGLGNHGYEWQEEDGFHLYVDGKSIGEFETFDKRPFAEAQLICKLAMHDPRPTSAEHPVIGYHTRIDTLNAAKKTLTVENLLEFTNAEPINIGQGYLFMASFQRTDKHNPNRSITDHFIDNVDYLLTDCSAYDNFDPPAGQHGVGEHKADTTEYKFWGSYFNLWGYARILRREVFAPRTNNGNTYNQFNPANFVIENSENYIYQNKLYMSVCESGDIVAGDVWRMTTEFFVDCGYDPAT